MALILHGPIDDYTRSCLAVDSDSPEIQAQAACVTKSAPDPIRALFEWVRDEISHSCDARVDIVTCSASDVLAAGTGLCYAKAHLLVALLRAQGIASGFCYQVFQDPPDPLARLHGLVAVQLPSGNWIRLDPRGNRDRVSADYDLESEQARLAFPDLDFMDDRVYASPLPQVVHSLTTETRLSELMLRLPTP